MSCFFLFACTRQIICDKRTRDRGWPAHAPTSAGGFQVGLLCCGPVWASGRQAVRGGPEPHRTPLGTQLRIPCSHSSEAGRWCWQGPPGHEGVEFLTEQTAASEPPEPPGRRACRLAVRQAATPGCLSAPILSGPPRLHGALGSAARQTVPCHGGHDPLLKHVPCEGLKRL